MEAQTTSYSVAGVGVRAYLRQHFTAVWALQSHKHLGYLLNRNHSRQFFPVTGSPVLGDTFAALGNYVPVFVYNANFATPFTVNYIEPACAVALNGVVAVIDPNYSAEDIPARGYYFVEVAGRCHNFVCVLVTSGNRPVGCNFLLRTKFSTPRHNVNTLFTSIFMPKPQQKR